MAIGTDTQSEPVSGRLDASLLHIDFVPKESQETVPSGDDPIRRTQSCTTSHMLVADWSASKGWEAPKIVPYAPFSLAPTASVLHYGTECFVRRRSPAPQLAQHTLIIFYVLGGT